LTSLGTAFPRKRYLRLDRPLVAVLATPIWRSDMTGDLDRMRAYCGGVEEARQPSVAGGPHPHGKHSDDHHASD